MAASTSGGRPQRTSSAAAAIDFLNSRPVGYRWTDGLIDRQPTSRPYEDGWPSLAAHSRERVDRRGELRRRPHRVSILRVIGDAGRSSTRSVGPGSAGRFISAAYGPLLSALI